jgi:replicative DNA helicase
MDLLLPDFEPEYFAIPSHKDAEGHTLALLLQGKGLHIMPKLTEDHFFSEAYRAVFKAIESTFETQKTTNIIAVSDRLTQEQAKPIGTIVQARAFLNEIALVYVTTHELALYDALENNRKRRFAMELFQDATIRISQGEMADAVFSDVQSALLDNTKKTNKKNIFNGEDLAQVLNEMTADSLAGSEKITGISTPFPKLNTITKGFQKGDYILLAARPSVGKTMLALQIALDAGFNQGESVMVFSFEMNVKRLVGRMLTIQGGGAFASVGDEMTTTQKLLVDSLKDKFAKSNISFDESTNLSVDDIYINIIKQNMLLEQQGKPKLSLVIIDHIGLVRGNEKLKDANAKLTHISRVIKNIANDLGVCVLALSQLNRTIETRQDKRPMLSDLRDSGSLEQDADVVMMLYRDDYQKDGVTSNEGEIIVRKNRHGAIGTQLIYKTDNGVFKPKAK